MMRLITKPMLHLMILFIFLLTGCSKGSDDNSSSSLSGTAATGAPIIGSVVITDATGEETSPELITLDGSFRVNVTGMQAPFLIYVTQESTGNVFYSFAYRSNITVNVTQLTTLALAIASNGDPANLLANWGSGAESSLSQDAIKHAAKIIYANLQSSFLTQGINPKDYNFINIPFDTNSNGLDGLLDLILIGFDFSLPLDGGAIDITTDGNPVAFNLDINLAGIDFGDYDNSSTDPCSDIPFPLPANQRLPIVLSEQTFTTIYSGNNDIHYNRQNVELTFCIHGSMFANDNLVSTSFTVSSASETMTTYTWVNNEINRKYEVVIFNGNFYEVNLNTADGTTFFGQLTPL